MSVKNPKEFWSNVSKHDDWKNYILPRKDDKDFDNEGMLEAERLFYFFDSSSTVLEYGCGIGRVVRYVAQRAKNVIGLDINPDFIKKAKKYVGMKNASFYASDEYSEKEVADLVYSLMVFQHNDSINRTKMIKHIHSLLKKEGIAIIQFPRVESDYYQETDFVHKFTKQEIEDYGKIFNRFRIVEGCLINYATEFNREIDHEYFLIAEE